MRPRLSAKRRGCGIPAAGISVAGHQRRRRTDMPLPCGHRCAPTGPRTYSRGRPSSSGQAAGGSWWSAQCSRVTDGSPDRQYGRGAGRRRHEAPTPGAARRLPGGTACDRSRRCDDPRRSGTASSARAWCWSSSDWPWSRPSPRPSPRSRRCALRPNVRRTGVPWRPTTGSRPFPCPSSRPATRASCRRVRATRWR